MQGAAWLLEPSREVVIAGTPGTASYEAMLAVVKKSYAPESVFILHPTDSSDEIIKLTPYVKWMVPLEGQAAAYICQNFACQKPLTDPEVLREKLTVPPEDQKKSLK